MGKILLFYKYISIEYPKQIMKWQKKICQDLGLTGRILIGHEGINGTVGGSTKNTERYKEIMNEHELFGNIDFKESIGGAEYFPRMYITTRDEVVHLGLDPATISPENGGKHLTAEEVHALISKKPTDLVILDARNDYEWAIGKFENAITPPIKNFRELPEYIEQNKELFKDKQVLMYCTGGIRCERASTFVKTGTEAKQVYQIEGGIHRYVEKYPDGFFRGKNYVFDGRIAVKVNDDVLGSCYVCNTSCDEYTNCINATCNKHYIGCEACLQKLNNCCSQTCHTLVEQNEVNVRTKPLKPQQKTACSLF